jgi:hypothetical protein
VNYNGRKYYYISRRMTSLRLEEGALMAPFLHARSGQIARIYVCIWAKKKRRKNYPTVTSKMLDPTDEDTAMSPKPFLATMTLVIRSGMDVPAAKKVKPIT